MSMSLARCGDALLEDLRAFVDQRVHQALHDLLVADLARRDAEVGAVLLDHVVDDLASGSRRACRARSRTSRRRSSGRSGPARTAGRRSCCSACRASRRSGACGWPSRCRCRPGRPCGTGPSPCRTSRSPCRPAAAWRPRPAGSRPGGEYCSIMRLPMKPSHTPETTAVFLIFLPSAITVASTSLRGLLAAHHFQQLHHVGRAEEVHADHVLRALGERGDLVDVERGGVGGEDRARLHHLVERLEHLLLDAHLLEHRLDHQVGVLQVVVARAWCVSSAMRCVVLVLLELALLDLRFVVLADGADAAVERFLLHLEHHHRDAGVEEVHRDAAAHGAGADHGDLLDLAHAACRPARRGSCWRRARP